MKIVVGSNLHKCFHEAGHIEVAYLYGATVTKAIIDTDGNGVTTVIHKRDLSTKMPVACGGYAVEKILFLSNRLVDEKRNPLLLCEFNKQAMNNARIDKYPFYLHEPFDTTTGTYPNSCYQPLQNQTWPPDSDANFMLYTDQNILNKLRPRMLIIEKLAYELCSNRQMTQKKIEAIRS